jgi:hypothetical protein
MFQQRGKMFLMFGERRMKDNKTYKKLLDMFMESAQQGEKSSELLELMELTQKLAKRGEVDPQFKVEVDSQLYIDLLGYYKSVSFEGNTPLAKKLMGAVNILTSLSDDISENAYYAGAVL